MVLGKTTAGRPTGRNAGAPSTLCGNGNNNQCPDGLIIFIFARLGNNFQLFNYSKFCHTQPKIIMYIHDYWSWPCIYIPLSFPFLDLLFIIKSIQAHRPSSSAWISIVLRTHPIPIFESQLNQLQIFATNHKPPSSSYLKHLRNPITMQFLLVSTAVSFLLALAPGALANPAGSNDVKLAARDSPVSLTCSGTADLCYVEFQNTLSATCCPEGKFCCTGKSVVCCNNGEVCRNSSGGAAWCWVPPATTA